MLSELFYACSFIFALCITIMYPKSDKKINGIVDGLFSYVSVTVVAAFLLFCFNLAKLPVSQITMGILFLLIGFVQVILIARKKKLQTHTWTKADFAALFLLLTMTGEENAYANRIKKNCNKKMIQFVGYKKREEILRLYAEDNYGLIVLSQLESFPIPFVEAMSFGVPIVAMKLPYAEEIVGDYPNVVWVESDYSNLQEAIETGMRMKKTMPREYSIRQNPWEKLLKMCVEIN